jgi:site-specific DNA-adenine methylase
MNPVKNPDLKAPFPWFGGKARAAALIWERLGDVDNYVEPFFGSGAILLGRPTLPGSETVNDLDCYLSNFWRAVQDAPDKVARFADWPVNEADLHARHLHLVNSEEFRERVRTDPSFYDAKLAGWWVWGLSCWIGGGWCALRPNGPKKQIPKIESGRSSGVNAVEKRRPQMTAGKSIGVQSKNGIHQKVPQLHPKGVNQTFHPPLRVSDQMPDLNAMCDKGANNDENLLKWFDDLAARFRRVRVACGDWKRVLGNTPLGLTSNVPPGFKTAVVLDPPYCLKLRDRGLYSSDGTAELSNEVRQWAIDHGDDHRLRIVLCGYEGEHKMPDTWECVAWKAAGGCANRVKANKNAELERIWFSPHCLNPRRDELQF